MQRQIMTWGVALGLIAVMASSAGAQEWAIKADFTNSCSCNVVCPCLFDSSPTLGHCDDNSLFEIKSGHYDGVRLDGISVVTTGRVGEWVKYYVSDDATDEQMEAAVQLLKASLPFFADMEVLAIEKVPVAVERSASKVKFSVPASTVEIEMMTGRDGKPIRIQNLPAAYTVGHTQYKSITNSHKSDDKEFAYSGTNAFTSKIDASSKK